MDERQIASPRKRNVIIYFATLLGHWLQVKLISDLPRINPKVNCGQMRAKNLSSPFGSWLKFVKPMKKHIVFANSGRIKRYWHGRITEN